MTTWDERYRTGTYPQRLGPHPVLERYLPTFPLGRALDVATGTGRNALPVAAAGYRVDAVDQSRAGLHIATMTDGTTAATAQLVARTSQGGRQSYPDISER